MSGSIIPTRTGGADLPKSRVCLLTNCISRRTISTTNKATAGRAQTRPSGLGTSERLGSTVLNSQNSTQYSSSVQRFRALTFAFLDEFETDELADLHQALDAFVNEAKGILDYDEAYEMFFRGLPGFDSFVAEYAARRFARFVALSNCGPAETLYGWERRAAACRGRVGAK